MELKEIRQITVLGAGIMGRGIAMVAARSGFDTLLYDVSEQGLEKALDFAGSFFAKSVERGKMTEEEREKTLSRLSASSDLSNVIGELIIEAIPEKLSLKHEVLAKVEEMTEPDTIIASNTSTIPITQIAAGLSRPEQVVGMHFFNPAPIMKLVEVISGERTDESVARLVYALAEYLGKKPVMVKDEPGFIVNRVARQFYVESLRVLEEGVASHEGIDRLMRATGFRMGPFELMDLIGIDTNHSVTCTLFDAFFQDEKYRPSRIQQKKVDAGQLGRKTGRGFYSYS